MGKTYDSEMQNSMLKCENLSKSYKEKVVLDNLNLVL